MSTEDLERPPLYDADTFPPELVDSEDEDRPEPTEEELAEFKDQVKEWTKLDDQIRKLSVATRERRTHQRALGSKVQDFMFKFGYNDLEMDAVHLRATVRKVKQKLSTVEIRSKLEDLVANGVEGNALLEAVFDAERPLLEKRSLRRIIPKVSMRL